MVLNFEVEHVLVITCINSLLAYMTMTVSIVVTFLLHWRLLNMRGKEMYHQPYLFIEAILALTKMKDGC
jgi:hypothetical protein